MILVLVIFVVCNIAYILFIIQIFSGWEKLKIATIDDNFIPTYGVSVIIAARNEEKFIQKCIQSILANQYPDSLFEIIVIDDHSSDNTRQMAENIESTKISVFSLSEQLSGKKAAISYGVSLAKYPVILCTDADCIVAQSWMKSHSLAYSSGNNKIMTGLVLPETDETILSRFQWLDFAATMAITAAGIRNKSFFLANGANISYKREVFEEVGGFEGNDHLSSGDDLFLMQKIAKIYPEQVGFLKSKESMVNTKSETGWASFISQRKRWATKSMKVGDKKIILIQSFVFIYVGLIFTGLTLGYICSDSVFWFAVSGLLVKMVTDFIFLFHLAKYFEKEKLMYSFPICFILYSGHILYSGISALLPSNFVWKGRVVK